MTIEVVDFPKPERLIWLCGECQSSTWFLYDDDVCECANCGNVSDASRWVTPIRDAPQAPEETDGGTVIRTFVGSPELAKRRVMKKLADQTGKLAMLISYFEDGSGSHWIAAETVEQRDWTVRKLRELADSIEKDPMNG
ncbi:hypothetical protein GOZ83_19705 [Agrobacterium vitis]|uniref:hypothetical protein n=1 Tax=Agrobacterium vitis TaxID=373 RepID=UPI0012E7716F|nr:hypothetical protein [Agrobacterium vitis]MVA47284.1 hypothetical protein [Agrobacterium vitis]